MALAVGTNSWATIAEADTLLTDRIDAEAWFALSDTGSPGERSKESLLVTAFSWLLGSSQLSLSVSLSDSNVINAQIEAAWFLQEYYQEIADRRAAIASGVLVLTMSKRREELSINNLGIPDFILGMLSEYQNSNVTALLLGEYDV